MWRMGLLALSAVFLPLSWVLSMMLAYVLYKWFTEVPISSSESVHQLLKQVEQETMALDALLKDFEPKKSVSISNIATVRPTIPVTQGITVSGEMQFDPETKQWRGNEQVLALFESDPTDDIESTRRHPRDREEAFQITEKLKQSWNMSEAAYNRLVSAMELKSTPIPDARESVWLVEHILAQERYLSQLEANQRHGTKMQQEQQTALLLTPLEQSPHRKEEPKSEQETWEQDFDADSFSKLQRAPVVDTEMTAQWTTDLEETSSDDWLRDVHVPEQWQPNTSVPGASIVDPNERRPVRGSVTMPRRAGMQAALAAARGHYETEDYSDSFSAVDNVDLAARLNSVLQRTVRNTGGVSTDGDWDGDDEQQQQRQKRLTGTVTRFTRRKKTVVEEDTEDWTTDFDNANDEPMKLVNLTSTVPQMEEWQLSEEEIPNRGRGLSAALHGNYSPLVVHRTSSRSRSSTM